MSVHALTPCACADSSHSNAVHNRARKHCHRLHFRTETPNSSVDRCRHVPASADHKGGPCAERVRLEASDAEYHVLECVLFAAGSKGAERLS